MTLFWDLSREEQLHGDASTGMSEDNRSLSPTENIMPIHSLLNEALPKINKHSFRLASQFPDLNISNITTTIMEKLVYEYSAVNSLQWEKQMCSVIKVTNNKFIKI